MSRIVITLDKSDIANLLNGCELQVPISVHQFDNLWKIVIKHEDYNTDCTVEEDCDD